MVYTNELVEIGLNAETTYGESPTAGDMDIYPNIVLTADGFFDDINWLEIRGANAGRDVLLWSEGKHVIEGSIEALLQNGLWFKAVLGTDSIAIDTPSVGNHTHTITGANDPPTYSMEVNYANPGGGTPLSTHVRGMAVDSMEVSSTEGEALRARLGIKAAQVSDNAGAQSTITADQTDPYRMDMAAFTYFGTAFAEVTDYSLTINNNGSVPNYTELVGQDYIPGKRSYELRTTVNPKDDDYFDQLLTAANNLTFDVVYTRGSNDTLTISCTDCAIKSAHHPRGEEGPVEAQLVVLPETVTVTIVDQTSTQYDS